MPSQPEIAVSACLLGQPVRHDGGHKHDRFISDSLSKFVSLTAICPELLSGLPVPRPTIQLRAINQSIRLVQSNDPDNDFTERMLQVAEQQAAKLGERISGLIVQKKSPSCGMERVPVSRGKPHPPLYDGTGLFTAKFTELCPLVPVEESGRLNDPILRENFLERVFALHRWRQMDNDSVQAFIEFHTRHKLNLMGRGTDAYRNLGRIVSGVTRETLQQKREAYIPLFMQTLGRRVNRKQHVNVLQHVMGYFKKELNRDEKAELLSVLQSYRNEETPLSTAMVLLQHHQNRLSDPYLQKQIYFHPYPAELGLRARV